MKKTQHLVGFFLSFIILFSMFACSCENSSDSVDFEKQESEDQEVDEISGVTNPDQKNKSKEESQSNKDKESVKSETSLTEKSDKTDDSLTKKSDAETTDTKKEENKTSSTISSTKTDTAKTTNSTVKSESSYSKSTTTVKNAQIRATTAKTTAARTTTAATTAATTTQTPTTSPPTTQPETIRVSLSVECINAYNAGNEVAIAVSNNGWILGDTAYTLQNGATVYDLIINSGLAVGARSTSYGQYIYSIQSLAEKAVNGQGGWLYFVNGSSPGYGVDSYVLSPGDSVQFSYTLGGY